MKKCTLILLTSACAALSGCGPSDGETRNVHGSTLITPGDEFLSDSDRLILQKIRLDIKNDPSLSESDITIRVTGGAVTIHGNLDSSKDKINLENRIKDFPGVKRVNNHIQVKSEAAIAEEDNLYNPEEQKIENERVNDDEDYDDEDEDDLDETSSGDQYFNDSDKTLIDSIRSTIQKDKLLFPVASKIKIIAEEGDITITGSVDSDQQKKLIAEKIKRIKEVKTLDNQLYVRKKATEG